MAKNLFVRKNITAAGITTLIAKKTSPRSGISGNISKITISNNSTSNPATVSVQVWDGSSVGYNICGNVEVPAGVVLVLEDNVAFSSGKFELRMETSGTSPILDVIIH
tara:strand:- start:250 stop:573 length:324 start_codon:yes stop_codon:yes gene_type:complete